MLFEIAVGDAYGRAFEFAEESKVKKYNKADKFHPSVGRYTDDTQMSIAIAEALLEDDPWTSFSLADRFVKTFKRDPRTGYSSGMYKLLSSCSNGKEFLDTIEPTKDSCGCVMRVLPLAFIKNIDKMFEMVSIQTRITHDVDIAVKASQAIAFVAHSFIHHDIRPNLIRGLLIEEFPEIDWSDWKGKVENKAVQVARAVMTVLMNNTNYTDILKSSVNFTGDVDSVAALAMGCASCSSYYDKTANVNLRNLEDDEFGKNYLLNLDAKLSVKFKTGLFG